MDAVLKITAAKQVAVNIINIIHKAAAITAGESLTGVFCSMIL